MVSKRRSWWRSCAAPFPTGIAGGRCAYWQTRLLSWQAASTSRAKRCAGCSKKNELKPWQQKEWCIPPEANGAFVYHMEDVLDVYTRPYDPRFPQVGMDETSKQLSGESRVPIP